MSSKTSKASPQHIQPASGSASSSKGLPYKVFKQGFLLKQTHRGVIKSLKRYWFVLFQQKDMMAFLYFQDEDHFLERKKNEGFFRIEDATSVNVLPEYMGRKHAFNIDTPRSKYVLVSESRYEMNEWLIALHGALEDYKNSTLARKKKSRPRTSSTSAVPSGPFASPNRTPPGVPKIKPSRPAPPAPPNKKKSSDELTTPSENPVPFPAQSPPSPDTPLGTIVANLMAESKNMAELDYPMVEEDPSEYDDDITPLSSTQTENSKSLPTLNNGLENGSSSPELDSETGEPIQRDSYMSLSQSYEYNNEHSITMPLDGQGKRRLRKRSSLKGRRSVSPPNLPPPPPPEAQKNEGQSPTGDQLTEDLSSGTLVFPSETEEVDSDQRVGQVTSQADTDQQGGQVDGSGQVTSQATKSEITGNRSPKPKPPPPVRTTSLAPKTPQEVEAELNKYLDEAFNQEDMQLPNSDDHRDNREPSPGILRKGEVKSVGKRSVMFKEDSDSQSYEPRIDQESATPSSVREAKLKLFGRSGMEDNVRYRRNSNEIKRLSGEPIKSPADELLESIETALQPTNYMESPSPPPARRPPPEAPEKKSIIVIPSPRETQSVSPPTDSTPDPSDDGAALPQQQAPAQDDPNMQSVMYRSVV